SIVRAEEDSLRGADAEPADLADFWRNANFDGASRLVERGGTPVGFAAVIERGGESAYWATVHPGVAGRGLSTWLLTGAEQRGRELGPLCPGAGCVAENRAAFPLFEGLGYREARHYFQLRIDFEGPPAVPEPPAGIELTSFRREDARAFHAALDDAFAEEW